MAKETLKVDIDSDLAERLRRYSEEHALNPADVIGELISALPPEKREEQPEDEAWLKTLTPRVRRLLGIARGGGGREEYRRFLEEKYG